MLDFEGWAPAILLGTWMTVKTTMLSALLGVCIGLLGAWGRGSTWAAIRLITDGYTTVIRAVPSLLLILFIYFGGTTLLVALTQSADGTGGVALPPLPAGVFALGLIFGAYATDVFKGAFEAIPKGMIEAGLACGMSRSKIFRLIKVPQMLRFALPGLGNVWISMLKDTSLISVVGLEELMRISELATTTTQRPMFFYLFAAILYFGLGLLSDVALLRAERWARRGQRVA